jgi:alpha-1,2-mannosyltransferase
MNFPTALASALMLVLPVPLLVSMLAFLFLRLYFVRLRRALPALTVAFLHPEALGGGGGERVLWVAVASVCASLPHARIAVIASWPPGSASGAHERIAQQFRLEIPDFDAVPLQLAHIADPARYPRFTMVLQAMAGILVGFEAYWRCRGAHVFVDTANMAFSLVPARMLGAVTVSYIHYPTISTDMLHVVRGRVQQFNNSGTIAMSPVLSAVKFVYYQAFAAMYAFAGRFSDITMVNSSWTSNHIQAIWGVSDNIQLDRRRAAGTLGQHTISTVFPPCDTSLLSTLSIVEGKRKRGLIISVGQFRPEKNHMLQLEIMHKLRYDSRYSSACSAANVKLIMIGGARHAADRERVSELRKSRARLGLDGLVDIRVNASWEELFEVLSCGWAGLHTMRDEHFGISIVELQAAGLIPVAHRSGGVQMDIILDGESGLLADDAEEYAKQLHVALVATPPGKIERMREAARASSARFSDENFGRRFAQEIAHAVELAVPSSSIVPEKKRNA